MSPVNRLFSYFPLLLTIAAVSALGVFAAWPNGWSAALVVFVIYLLAPMSLRIVLRWAPIKPGVVAISDRTFCAWLASHHIQAFYDALPYLESLLRVIPGFYSMWLRMWGSRIGYGVEWPVRMDVLDRDMVDIGNRVVFAREVELSAHVRQKLDGGLRVLVRPLRVGSYAFIGAGTRMGPGAVAPANANVPAMTVVDVNETFGEPRRHHAAPFEAEFALG
jgi:acetyltransferase-like isoleucine patch superfamily enzyme